MMEDQQAEPINQEMYEQPAVEQQDIQPVSWTASEYIAHEKSSRWYAALFGGSVLLVLFVFIITRDILASIVVLLICSAMSVYAGRKPSTKRYVIDSEGVSVDEKHYPYAMFRSFSIVEEGPIESIWLKPIQRFAPTVVMFFPPESEEQITNAISAYLPYEQLEMDAIDKISKRMRF